MLLDPATAARHRQAAGALRALGIAVAGLFSVRPDLGEEDLERLREHVRELGIVMPIAHAPARRRGEARGAPGSALPAQLIQADLPRGIAAWPGRERAAWDLLRRRPGLVWSALPGAARAREVVALRLRSHRRGGALAMEGCGAGLDRFLMFRLIARPADRPGCATLGR